MSNPTCLICRLRRARVSSSHQTRILNDFERFRTCLKTTSQPCTTFAARIFFTIRSAWSSALAQLSTYWRQQLDWTADEQPAFKPPSANLNATLSYIKQFFLNCRKHPKNPPGVLVITVSPKRLSCNTSLRLSIMAPRKVFWLIIVQSRALFFYVYIYIHYFLKIVFAS